MPAALGRLAVARRRSILAGTPTFLAVAALFCGNVAAHLGGVGAADPGAESARAATILSDRFPASRPDLALLVEPVHAAGVDDPLVAAQGRRLAAALAAEAGIACVSSYWDTGSATLRARDGRQALIVARISAPDEKGADAAFKRSNHGTPAAAAT